MKENPFKIIIDDPLVIDDHYKTWTRDHDVQLAGNHPDRQQLIKRDGTGMGRDVVETFIKIGITPQTHPKVIDLCAGAGSMAHILSQNGWQDIVCMDREAHPQRLWDNFLYIDLHALTWSLKCGYQIPESISKLQGSFDLIVCVQGDIGDPVVKNVSNFFLRKGGVVFPDYYCPPITKNPTKWKKLHPYAYEKL